MFNYLQEKRPKRRKSANLLSSFSTQSDSKARDDSKISPPVSQPDEGCSLESPTQNLSRLASRQKKRTNEPPPERQTHWSFKGDRPHTSGSSGQLAYQSHGGYNDFPIALQQSASQKMQESQALGITSERPKRLIDVRFEQMRAAPGPSFQHLPFDSGLQASLMPQPLPQAFPPPPPPKSAPGHTNWDEIQESPSASEEVKPTIPRSNTLRYPKSFNKPQRQSSVLPPVDEYGRERSLNQPRFGRPRLNMMNPMQILARRRSQKPLGTTLAEDQKTPAPQLPADYDPRIRGKVVHDFSAPKISRVDGDIARVGQRESVRLVAREDSPHSQERQHTPMFKEEFDDGLEKSQDPATRSEAFLRTAAAQASESLTPDSAHLPEFAPKIPLKIATNQEILEKSDAHKADPVPPMLEIVVESPAMDQSKPLPLPPRATSSSTSISDKTVSGLGSPQRHKSTSSRFSFDLAGVGSAAQEKLLEDKHREKVQQKQRESVLSYQSTNDDDQYDDYDDMDDDGFEERIPGVNCDEDESFENNLPTLQRDAEAFPIASPNKSSFESSDSPVSTGVTSLDTPFFGVPWAQTAASKSSPNVASLPAGEVPSTETLQDIKPQSRPTESTSHYDNDTFQNDLDLEDDIYFDDGMIDEMGDASFDDGFDENVFDDNSHGLYGLPLRDRTIKPSDDHEEHTEQSQKQDIAHSNSVSHKGEDSKSSVNRSLSSGAVSAELRDALTELGHPNITQFSHTAGLTQDNLAAYEHNTLVNAVQEAALNGSFDRVNSLASSEPPQQPPTLHVQFPEHPTSHSSNDVPHLRGGLEDTDYDDNSDDLDEFITEANAEALENDEEGFYSSEFGFYARGANADSEFVNGGYFGGKGVNEALMRSHSGKATNFQEPPLTPITERSEFSNRNSTISLVQMVHPHGFPPMPSPGFEMSHEDLNTQLAMLKQLRRGAWGGSDASLPSSAGSQTQLNQNIMFSPTFQSSGGGGSNTNIINSASSPNLQNLSTSLPSSSSNESGGESPTITLPLQRPSKSTSPPSAAPSMPPPPRPSLAATNPNQTNNTRKAAAAAGKGKEKAKGHHERNDSAGAESVSYKTEGGKWVMEKRRMSETGETMMVGRRVLDAGTI